MIDYFKEFQLNLENQLDSTKLKEVCQVGYEVDNNLCFTIIIPNIFINSRSKQKDKMFIKTPKDTLKVFKDAIRDEKEIIIRDSESKQITKGK